MLRWAMANPDQNLFRAIDRGDEIGVKAALADGANLDARRKHNTPLLDAVFAKNPIIVGILARAGAKMTQVPDSRDPLREAFTQGHLPTVAALLDAPPTPPGLAQALRLSEMMLLREGYVRRNLMRSCWKEVAAELLPKVNFATPGERDRWWGSAAASYSPDPETVDLLHAHCPPPREASVFREMAENGLSIPVMQAMHTAGHLDVDMMFHAYMGSSKGFLEIALSKQYTPIPRLKWLLRLAKEMPGGLEKLTARAPAYMVHALGTHASMPLARQLAKAVGEDPIALGAQGILPNGTTTMHLLLEGNQDIPRRLDICSKLMQAGADPMALDWRGQPACYKACMLQTKGHEVMELMASYGADFAVDGVIEKCLDKDKDTPAYLVEKARTALRIHQVNAEHQALQQITSQAPRRKPGSRL